jgi:hypothetical protein
VQFTAGSERIFIFKTSGFDVSAASSSSRQLSKLRSRVFWTSVALHTGLLACTLNQMLVLSRIYAYTVHLVFSILIPSLDKYLGFGFGVFWTQKKASSIQYGYQRLFCLFLVQITYRCQLDPVGSASPLGAKILRALEECLVI